jgi:hypothetical protein
MRRLPLRWGGIFLGVLILATALACYEFSHRHVSVNLDSPESIAAQSVITRYYRLKSEMVCNPGSNVSALSDVLMDAPDYHPSQQLSQAIVTVYGAQRLHDAGYLTAMQAYYLNQRQPAPTLDPSVTPRIRPTLPGIYYCPTPSVDPSLIFQSVQRREQRLIVRFDDGPSTQEATLINADGHWFIVSMNVLVFHP